MQHRYHSGILRPDFCDLLIAKDVALFSNLFDQLIELLSLLTKDKLHVVSLKLIRLIARLRSINHNLYRHHLIQLTLKSNNEADVHEAVESPVLKIFNKSIQSPELAKDLISARMLRFRFGETRGVAMIQIAQGARGFIKVLLTF
jgi:hypothetical protein